MRSQRRVYSLAVELLAEGHRRGQGGAFEEALSAAVRAKARDLFSRLDLERKIGEFSLERIREQLEGAILVELFDTGDALWRFVVSRERASLVELTARDEVLGAGERLAAALARGDQPSARDLEALSAALLDDLEVEGARLLVAPVASLSRIPWELLPIGGGRMLVDESVVGYLPSAALLFDGAADPLPRSSWLAVASQGPPDPPTLRGLAPLPHVQKEVELLQQLGGNGELLVDERATADSVLARLRSPGADVVHLAVHAVVDERPGYGSLLLLEDRALRPDDLASTELNVGLAVLAACSTTLGSDPSGLVLQSLTGAWLAAGVRNVIATLWDVDDQTTLAFMEQFYAQLGRGLEPADALVAAKRRLRTDPRWSASDSWAAYVLTGIPSAGPSSPSRGIVVGLSGLGIALLLAGAARWRVRRSI